MIYLHKHIKKLTSISHFNAKGSKNISPNTIPKGMEYIELLRDGEVIFEGKCYRRGTMFWHRGGDKTIHHYSSGKPYSCFVFKFNVISQKQRFVHHVSQWHDMDTLDDSCEDLLRCFHNDNYKNSIIGPYAYSTLYWQAYRSKVDYSILPKNHHAITSSLKFIEDHFKDDLVIKDIAKAAGVSEPHLYLLFRQHLTKTPHQYILMYRLQRAKRLLASTYNSIKEIGFSCGFNNSESFHRIFKSQYAMTPGEYRKYHMPS